MSSVDTYKLFDKKTIFLYVKTAAGNHLRFLRFHMTCIQDRNRVYDTASWIINFTAVSNSEVLKNRLFRKCQDYSTDFPYI